MGAAGGVGAHQHPVAVGFGELGQGIPQHGDVVGGVVGVGPSRSQQHRQRFAGTAFTVVEIGQ